MSETVETALSEAITLLDNLAWLCADAPVSIAITAEMLARITEIRDDLLSITTYRPLSPGINVATRVEEVPDLKG